MIKREIYIAEHNADHKARKSSKNGRAADGKEEPDMLLHPKEQGLAIHPKDCCQARVGQATPVDGGRQAKDKSS